MTHPGVLPMRSSMNDGSPFGGVLAASAFGAGALAGAAALGGSAAGFGGSALAGAAAFGGSAAFTSGAAIFGGSTFAGSGALPFATSACACNCAPVWPLSSSARCRSFSVFSSSPMRFCASFSALSRATTSSAPGLAAAPLPTWGDTLS